VKKLLISIIAILMLLAPSTTLALPPNYDLVLVDQYWYEFANTTDANGVDCLSDEDIWERTWQADKYTGTFTASVYLCPTNPNAPLGPSNIDIWASYWVQGGSASLTLTYPNGMVVPARHNETTDWTEVCMVDYPFYHSATQRMPGIYTLTFVGNAARKPVVKLETEFAENVRGQYWWGCDSSWWN
jgi:hypothetical protein